MRLRLDQGPTARAAAGAGGTGGASSFPSSSSSSSSSTAGRIQKVIRALLEKLVLADHYQGLAGRDTWVDIYGGEWREGLGRWVRWRER